MASVSFARIAGTSTTFAGTNAYTQAAQPTGTGAPTGQEVSDYYLLTVFTKPYLDAHTLSYPSWRYAYYVWFVFIGAFIVWSILHQCHVRFGALGALWRSIAMRKISFGKHSHRKKHKTNAPSALNNASKGGWSTPTLAQLFGLAVFLAFIFIVSYVGPDYINPQECMFGGICGYHPVNGDSATNQYARHRYKRAVEFITSSISTSSHLFHKRRIARYGWSPLTDPLLAGPNYTIDKNFWASGNRIGLIAYALLPLSVGLALKQWPMNPFATPFFTNLHIDKTAFWHRWIGRIIWILSTVHAGLWTKQLFIDINPFDEPTWNCVWRWHRLAAGGAAYIALTLMVLLSFKPFRNRFYELFYYSHVLLVLIFLVTIVIHYQALQGWALLAVCLWAFERLVRLGVWIWLNFGKGIPLFGEGKIGKMQFTSKNASEGGFKVHNVEKRLSAEGQKYAAVNGNGYQQSSNPYLQQGGNNAGSYGDEEWSTASRSTNNLHAHPSLAPGAAPLPRQPVYAFGPGNDDLRSPALQAPHHYDTSRAASPLNPRAPISAEMYGRNQTNGTLAMHSSSLLQEIPRGYALAQILPGRVMKLTLHTPRHMNWKAGQHVQLTLPSVRWWQSHPYSIVNAQNMTEALIEQNVRSGDRSGSEIVLLMSVRKGFTRRLFKSICQKRRRLVNHTNDYAKDGTSSTNGQRNGVLIRAQTYLAAGSAARAHWDDFSTVVLFAAGTGVTYTVSVLQHLCYMMAEKEAALRGEQPSWSKGKKAKKPTNVTRVRFVWVLRDYAHLAWIAPILRRCLDISDPARLRIDLFVTRDSGRLQSVNTPGDSTPMSLYTPNAMMEESKGDLFRAPAPGFARNGGHGRVSSTDSSYSDLSQTVVDSNEWPNSNAYKGYDSRASPSGDVRSSSAADQMDSDENADFSVTDMILFDGEDERPTFEDEEMSRNVKKEGKVRRGLSRKKKNAQQPQSLQTTSQRLQNQGNTLANMVDEGEMSADERPLSPPAAAGRSHAYPPAPSTPRQGSTYSFGDGDKESFMASGAATPTRAKRFSAADLPLLNDDEVGHFDMSDQDKEDLSVIAELARSGRPDLSGILDAEIERSQGNVVVGCCGPRSLNNLLRNMVAKRISPSRVARGDPRGNIELITEDFFY